MNRDRFLDLFLAESREHLGAAFELHARLELDPRDESIRRELMRHAHSLKGMSATLGYAGMATLAHAAEEVLERHHAIRDLAPTLPLIRETLACIGAMLEAVARQEPIDSAEARRLAQRLEQHLGSGAAALESIDPVRHSSAVEPFASRNATPTDPRTRYWKIVLPQELERPDAAEWTVTVLLHLATAGTLVDASPPMLAYEAGQENRLQLILASTLERGSLEGRLQGLVGSDRFSLEPAPPPAPPPSEERGVHWIRVRADLLDSVSDDVQQLRLEHRRLRAAIPADCRAARQALERTELRLKKTHGELLQLRMIPFDSVAHRLHVAVQEVASTLSKEVDFGIVGGRVRLDRAVLDALVDPLIHAVRNAIDHGIESTAERRAAGKPDRGRVSLELQRLGDRVQVTLTDDGRGMDPGRIKARAVATGLVNKTEAATISREQLLMLTTRPGFTTARSVGQISGRGVGLDVVRDTVERLGGVLTLGSEPGSGCAVKIRLPLTQALIQTLLVRAAGGLYALPLDVVERASESPEGFTERPLIRLDERLGAARNDRPEIGGVVTLCDAWQELDLIVDEIVGRQDVVVRPVRGPLAELPEYAGAALMEDGTIALLLDPAALAAD